MTPIIIALLLYLQPATDERRDEIVDVGQAIEAAAELSGFDPFDLAALVVRESRGRVDVVGKRGECGPAQVMGWHLRPRMTCDELKTADGGMLGAVRALQQWARAGHEDVWACFASGNICRAARSERRRFRIRAKLRHLAATYYAAAATRAAHDIAARGSGFLTGL